MRTIPPPHPCPQCGRPCWGRVCKTCYAKPARPHLSRASLYTPDERKRRAATVRAHRDTYGDWCPGYKKAPHPSARLSADHVVEVFAGGDEEGALQVLCPACNTAKANQARAHVRKRTQKRVTTSRPWLG